MAGHAQPVERQLAGPHVEPDHAVVFLKGDVRESAVLAEGDAFRFQRVGSVVHRQAGDVVGPTTAEACQAGKRGKGDAGNRERGWRDTVEALQVHECQRARSAIVANAEALCFVGDDRVLTVWRDRD